MLDAGHCAEAGLERASLQPLFAFWLLYAWDERALVPAILHRIERCGEGDLSALSHLAALLAVPPTPDVADELHSRVLGNHIGLSEIWSDDPPPLEALEAIVAGATFSIGLSTRLRRLADDWPVYAQDVHVGSLGATSRPMLMLQGELDPATPPDLAQAVGDFYDGTEQRFLLVPRAPHSFAAPTADGSSCTLDVFFGFVEDPHAPPSGCVDQILPLDFTGSASLAQAYLGTPSAWDDAAADSAAAPADLHSFRSWRARQ